MATVLIPSDDRYFLDGYVHGYRACGHQVVVGLTSYRYRSIDADIVHYLWPETFSWGREPSVARLRAIEDDLDYWAGRARCMASVQNLHPHGYRNSKAYRRLYDMVYRRCSVIHHFSRVGYEIVLKEYPIVGSKRNVILTGFNYDWLLRPDANRVALRTQLGIRQGEFVILTMGTLRTWEEVKLVMTGIGSARVSGKRLLNMARLAPGLLATSHLLRKSTWYLWRRRQRAAIEVSEAVPNDCLYKYLEAADAVVVPRIDTLSSGLVAMGMTFGRLVIAPNVGAIPEYLAGTSNPLYRAGDGRSLALAIERAAELDFDAVSARNRQIAAGWNWPRIIDHCVRQTAMP